MSEINEMMVYIWFWPYPINPVWWLLKKMSGDPVLVSCVYYSCVGLNAVLCFAKLQIYMKFFLKQSQQGYLVCVQTHYSSAPLYSVSYSRSLIIKFCYY
jgi:hypothetical protein